MKKILYFVIIFNIYNINAQYKYKLENKIIVDLIAISNGIQVSAKAENTSNLLFNIGVIDFNSPILIHTQDEVVEFNEEILTLKYKIFKATSPTAPTFVLNYVKDYNNCFSDEMPRDNDYGYEIKYLRLYRILPLTTLNNFSSTNNEIKVCETKIIKAASCNNSGSFSYAVDFFIGNDLINPIKSLPYALREPTFSVAFSDFNNLPLGSNINIKIRYTNDINGFTDALTYKFISCSPQLQNFTPIDATCSYKQDGKFSMILDQQIPSNKKLVVSLFFEDQTNPGSFSLLTQKSTTSLTANGNSTYSYLWPDDVLPGNYSVKYQTFDTTTPNPVWDSLEATDSFTIDSPSEFTFSGIEKNKVYCYGGNDGAITITGTGGTLPYKYKKDGDANWTAFANGTTHTISGLSSGTYNIKIRDANDCSILNTNGSDKAIAVAVGQIPNSPIAITFAGANHATAFGFNNGDISVDVKGGTTFANGSYNFTWRNSSNTVVASTTTQNVASGYRIIVNNLPADTYTLTVTDANYTTATSKTGCTYQYTYTITEPPLLTLNLQETNAISCNSTNTYSNPSNDGQLTAITNGGVAFSPLINGFYKYKYTWKKKNTSGIWEIIPGLIGNIASNLTAGEYAVNIEDANGIIIGAYTNNLLVTATDRTIQLSEPQLLTVSLTKQNVFCNNGNDGAIQATVNGGTGSYTFLWNNGANTQNLSSIPAGNYSVSVTDGKGCEAQASTIITEPATPLEVSYTFFEPTFAGATNGWIKAIITGGSPLADGSYTFLWEDAANSDLVAKVNTQINAASYELTLTGLGEGTYNLTIQDKNYTAAIDKSNCTIIKSAYIIDDPDVLIATVTIQTPISCNSTNIYTDPFNDGALIADASGGIKLQPSDNGGLSYYYTWKKESSTGVWEILPLQTSNIATGLSDGNYAVNIEDANGIILGVYIDNALDHGTDVVYSFEEPELLAINFNKQDVFCYGGSDGWAEAIISGGTGAYTLSWNNGDSTLRSEDLVAGTYTLTVTDEKGCKAIESIEILQPDSPLIISYTAFSRPSTDGATDAWIEAQISGGTALGGGSYTYSWTDENGLLLNSQTSTSFEGSASNIFQIRLNAITAGTYLLTIEDANYTSAITKQGCTNIANQFTLYEPIEASINVLSPISCNQNNTFGNPFSDGELKVNVTGGLPFVTGEPYIYHWKKQNSSGIYVNISAATSDIAINLSAGNYALNVEDSLGTIIGIYDSNTLITPTDAQFTFEEPQLLEVSLSSDAISCDAGNNGTATVIITGGIGNYTIEWSNGDTTPILNNLIAGTYIVYVTDERGCKATGQITVGQPGGLKIDILEQKNPSCYLGNDGSIAVEATGGQAPYTYLWSTGTSISSIKNLSQGLYSLKITDANGCTAFKEITLDNPELITVDLGEDRTLCINQTHELDIEISDSNASYLWKSDNGFTSTTAAVSLTKPGIYTVTLTTGFGCIASDTVEIKTVATEINSEFIITSQSFAEEDIILINTSTPKSSNLEWILPEAAKLIEETNETLTLRFSESGTYEITLRAIQGDCFQDYTKSILVEEARDLPDVGDADTPFVSEFIIAPNPTTGQFKATITLQKEAAISLRIYSLNAYAVIDDKKLQNEKEYEVDYNLNLSAGMYLLLLETPKGSKIHKIIIK